MTVTYGKQRRQAKVQPAPLPPFADVQSRQPGRKIAQLAVVGTLQGHRHNSTTTADHGGTCAPLSGVQHGKENAEVNRVSQRGRHRRQKFDDNTGAGNPKVPSISDTHRTRIFVNAQKQQQRRSAQTARRPLEEVTNIRHLPKPIETSHPTARTLLNTRNDDRASTPPPHGFPDANASVEGRKTVEKGPSRKPPAKHRFAHHGANSARWESLPPHTFESPEVTTRSQTSLANADRLWDGTAGGKEAETWLRQPQNVMVHASTDRPLAGYSASREVTPTRAPRSVLRSEYREDDELSMEICDTDEEKFPPTYHNLSASAAKAVRMLFGIKSAPSSSSHSPSPSPHALEGLRPVARTESSLGDQLVVPPTYATRAKIPRGFHAQENCEETAEKSPSADGGRISDPIIAVSEEHRSCCVFESAVESQGNLQVATEQHDHDNASCLPIAEMPIVRPSFNHDEDEVDPLLAAIASSRSLNTSSPEEHSRDDGNHRRPRTGQPLEMVIEDEPLSCSGIADEIGFTVVV